MTPIEMLKKAHNDIFTLAINGDLKNIKGIHNLMGEAINQLEQRSPRSRERVIIAICDEDLENFDIDPTTVTDEQFDAIAEDMASYLDESFSGSLHGAIQNVLTPKKKHRASSGDNLMRST